MIKIGNYKLNEDLEVILNDVKKEITNGKLGVIKRVGDDIQCCCPIHASGLERRPSCFIRVDDGIFHCFTDNQSGGVVKFVAACMDIDGKAAETWLINKYGERIESPVFDIKYITKPQVVQKKFMNESILSTFESFHPYMKQRKLSDEVIKKFEIKYDVKTKSLVFPVRDKYGRLVYLTRRSVEKKNFLIDKGINKEVYLLYDIIKEKSPEAYICESQINALCCQSWGKKAVATFGCGCPDNQINDLNNTDVKHYIIAFDPDSAGLKGTLRLCEKLSKNKFISVMILPQGKDVGDLTEEEFKACPILTKNEFLENIPNYYKE